jgi:ATP-dependent DNA ligase
MLGTSGTTLKAVLPAAIELSKKQYLENLLPEISTFYITDKADGIRCIVAIEGDQLCCVSAIGSTTQVIEQHINDKYILECEDVDGVFYAFDILMFRGQSMAQFPFDERLSRLNLCTTLVPVVKVKQFVKLDADRYMDQIRKFHSEINDPMYRTQYFGKRLLHQNQVL